VQRLLPAFQNYFGTEIEQKVSAGNFIRQPLQARQNRIWLPTIRSLAEQQLGVLGPSPPSIAKALRRLQLRRIGRIQSAVMLMERVGLSQRCCNPPIQCHGSKNAQFWKK
jgi:hypothetical protein